MLVDVKIGPERAVRTSRLAPYRAHLSDLEDVDSFGPRVRMGAVRERRDSQFEDVGQNFVGEGACGGEGELAVVFGSLDLDEDVIEALPHSPTRIRDLPKLLYSKIE